METGTESTEWLNFYLDRFWSQYEPGLSEMIASNVNYVLESSKPSFLVFNAGMLMNIGRFEIISVYIGIRSPQN
jgi:hypothetical protein